MSIDLSDPFIRTVAGGLAIAIILGTYHYIVTLVKLNVINQKFSNILSEMDSLHKEHEKKISSVKKADDIIIKELLEQYDNKVKEIYETNKQSSSLYGSILRPAA
ncbi:hypothetical protein KAR91_58270 [Candidatus Pacearchaeota archaeon]|nr:hypothetical protein [Candidatus Pacearchaeota archaeon]